MFQTGIAINSDSPNDIIVAAATWYKSVPPNFPTRKLTLPYMKENLAAVIVVRGQSLVPTVNTACNRTVERLLIKRMIVPSNPPKIELLLKPPLAEHLFSLPVVGTKKHWLIDAAETALNDWIRGVF